MHWMDDFKGSAQSLKRPRVLALAGMLLALQVVLAMFSVPLGPTLRISFGFLPMGISGALLGPVPCILQAVLADFLGMVVKPMGSYFPGYTLTAALNGLFYSLVLYGAKPSWQRSVLVKILTNVLLHIFLNTLWSAIMTGQAFWVLMPARMLKNLLAIPVEGILLWVVWMFAHRLVARMNWDQLRKR